MMMFSITGSEKFFANFVIFARNKRKTAYRFIVHNTSRYGSHLLLFKYQSVGSFLSLLAGMGRDEKYVHREVANAKLYRFRDSTF